MAVVGLSIPSEIAGVKIPPVSLDDLMNPTRLQELAVELCARTGTHAAGLDGVIEQAERVYNVLDKGCGSVSRTCSTLVATSEAITEIQAEMRPVMPLINAVENPVAAFECLSKESFAACIQVAEHILGLSTVLQSIGDVLKDVRAAFEELAKAAQPIVDKVREVLEDVEVANQFGTAMNLTQALLGVDDFFAHLEALNKELLDIKDILTPFLKDLEHRTFSPEVVDAMVHGKTWQQVVDAIRRFWPAWTQSQELYNTARGFACESLGQSRTAWESFRTCIQSCSDEVPSWLKDVEDPLCDAKEPHAVDVQEAPAGTGALAALLPTNEAGANSLAERCCESAVRLCGVQEAPAGMGALAALLPTSEAGANSPAKRFCESAVRLCGGGARVNPRLLVLLLHLILVLIAGMYTKGFFGVKTVKSVKCVKQLETPVSFECSGEQGFCAAEMQKCFDVNDYDGDGIPDSIDEDDDNDGIPDFKDIDNDGNGIPDMFEKKSEKRDMFVSCVARPHDDEH